MHIFLRLFAQDRVRAEIPIQKNKKIESQYAVHMACILLEPELESRKTHQSSLIRH